MNYLNVGAQVRATGENVATKAALKRMVRDEPTALLLVSTSPLQPGGLRTWTVSELDRDTTFSVVGPDPFNDRRWYASIQLGRAGNPVVS